MGRARINAKPGDRYGMLTLVEETAPEPRPEPSTSRYRRFLVRCDCGKLTNVRLDNVRAGLTTSCGCYGRTHLGLGRLPRPSPLRVPIVPGERHGRLTLVREVERERTPGSSPTSHRRVICACDCGALVSVRLRNVRRGQTTSCGCSRRKVG